MNELGLLFCLLITRLLEQVLDVVRSNYDSLTLRLQDNLDNYERYTERPKEAVFFSDLVSVRNSRFISKVTSNFTCLPYLTCKP